MSAYVMTIEVARRMLLEGDLNSLEDNKPAGLSMFEVITDVLHCTNGKELEIIGTTCFGLFRMENGGRGGTEITMESFESYKERLLTYTEAMYRPQVKITINNQLADALEKMKELFNKHSHVGNLGIPTFPPQIHGPYDFKSMAFDHPMPPKTITLPPVADERILSWNIVNVPEKCSHQWKTYDSGWSKYDYCAKCDEKKQ